MFCFTENKFELMGMQLEDYINEKKIDLEGETYFEKKQKKDMKRKLVEHETIYGVGKPLTPISNMTVTPNRSRRIDSKSRMLTPGSSMGRFPSVSRLAPSSSSKRVSEQHQYS